ncbi:MAG: hypothetical protein ACO20B_04380 [Burkholderiaceae bacterium]
MKSVRSHPFWVFGLILLCTSLLSACSPTYDWRSVSDESQGWQALFPGKPAMVERTITLQVGDGQQPVQLMLRAVRIEEQTFSVGVARFVNPTHPPLQALADVLRESRVQNIRGELVMQPKAGPTDQPPGLVVARGQIQLKPNATPVPARLQTLSRIHQGQVIEALVVGPEASYHQEAAQQFLESLRIGF